MGRIKYKQLTTSDIEALHKHLAIADKAKDLLNELLVIGKQLDFWENKEQFYHAKRVTLDYMKCIKKYKKEVLNGLYKCEGEYKKSALL